MSKSVRGAERQDRQGHVGTGQRLDYIVDGAIAATGKHGVAAGGHSASSVVGGFLAGMADRQFCPDTGGADDADGRLQFRFAAPAAGVGIDENGRFPHLHDRSNASLPHTPGSADFLGMSAPSGSESD